MAGNDTTIWPILLSGFIGAAFTQIVNWVLHVLNRREQKKQRNASYAAVWCSVMTELWHALNRIEYTAQLFLTHGQYPMYEIQLVEGLGAKFLERSRHPEVSKRVYDLYSNITKFKRCFHVFIDTHYEVERLKKEQKSYYSQDCHANHYFSAALYIAQCRHFKMTLEFESCLNDLNDFCENNKLTTGLDLPKLNVLDEKWRIDESLIGTQKHDLTPV